MTLSFRTKTNGKETKFVEKILAGLHGLPYFNGFIISNKYEIDLDYLETASPKIHTIRKDRSGRWKEGRNIHFVINNRMKNRFQFVPQLIPVISTQMIWIRPNEKMILVERHVGETRQWEASFYWHPLTEKDKKQLIKNDGFDNSEDFWDFFQEEFGGVIIHWTNLKY